jgi:hypothetical protein
MHPAMRRKLVRIVSIREPKNNLSASQRLREPSAHAVPFGNAIDRQATDASVGPAAGGHGQ